MLGLNPQYLLESLGAVQERVRAHHVHLEREREQAPPVLITPQTSVDKGGGETFRTCCSRTSCCADRRRRPVRRRRTSLGLIGDRGASQPRGLPQLCGRRRRAHPGPNVFVGRNGQGKTNLAEAIAFFATLGSHRVSSDQPIVRDGADAAIIRVRLAHGGRRVQLEVQINRQGANRARMNGSGLKPSELPRYAQVVLFAPEDLQIVRGDPSSRRRFADQLLDSAHPAHGGGARRLRARAPAATRAAEVRACARHPRRRAVDARRVGRQTRELSAPS